MLATDLQKFHVSVPLLLRRTYETLLSSPFYTQVHFNLECVRSISNVTLSSFAPVPSNPHPFYVFEAGWVQEKVTLAGAWSHIQNILHLLYSFAVAILRLLLFFFKASLHFHFANYGWTLQIMQSCMESYLIGLASLGSCFVCLGLVKLREVLARLKRVGKSDSRVLITLYKLQLCVSILSYCYVFSAASLLFKVAFQCKFPLNNWNCWFT